MVSVARPSISIVLGVMGRVELAEYGFRSWTLQAIEEPYEVILCLFNNERDRFERLAEARSPYCRLVIKEYDPPAFFNISAANNLGIHWATGDFVMFANADVIYPSTFCSVAVQELKRSGVSYAACSRVNLSRSQSEELAPVASYRVPGEFDSLATLPVQAAESVWKGINGWIVRARTIRAIGGFDSNVLVMEDVDVATRVMHYLRRTGAQQCSHGLMDLFGFHVYHATSELFDAAGQAAAILDARRVRLAADPDTPEDCVATPLDSHLALVEALRNTARPPRLARYRDNTLRKALHRFRLAAEVLVGRRVY